MDIMGFFILAGIVIPVSIFLWMAVGLMVLKIWGLWKEI